MSEAPLLPLLWDSHQLDLESIWEVRRQRPSLKMFLERAELMDTEALMPTLGMIPISFLSLMTRPVEMLRRCFSFLSIQPITDHTLRHDLYKWQHDHRTRPVRSASFSHVPVDRETILDPHLARIKEPGGFRRSFLANRAQEQGLEAPTMVRNVVDFLYLYGHFVCPRSPLPNK